MVDTRKHMDMVRKVHAYRNRGLSYREIAALLKKDVRQIHRWAKYTVDTLSPPGI